MTGTRIAVLALSVVLLVASGCGDDDDEADKFREDYNAAVDRLAKINSEISSAAGGAAEQSNQEIADEFGRIAETAEQTRTNLSELQPPEDARDEFEELLGALREGVSNMRAVSDAADNDNPEAAREAAEELARSGEEINAAEEDLKDAVEGG
jgi:methyl-accepting chemotaxis protein